MAEIYNQFLNASLEFGEGYDQMVGGDPESITKNYDYVLELQSKVLDYHIYKIFFGYFRSKGFNYF